MQLPMIFDLPKSKAMHKFGCYERSRDLAKKASSLLSLMKLSLAGSNKNREVGNPPDNITMVG